MKRTTLTVALLALAAAPLSAQAIDPARSTVTIHVSKAGLFGGFGHNHTVRAPIQRGQVDTQARAVTLSFASAELRVLDPDASLKDRAEIQRTMLGPQVLDADRYPEIRFRSTRVERTSMGIIAWQVRGELTLHGVTKPVVLPVGVKDGQYRGEVRLKQSEFGIKPVSFAGGTVKVKDEVVVQFEIALTQ